MAGAFSDGLLRGFDMVERYKNNEFERNRLSQLDERDERRYQDKLERQVKQDKIEQQRYEEKSAREDKELNSLMDYRDKTLKNTQGEREWQRKYQEKQDQRKQDIAIMPAAYDLLEAGQELPTEHEEMFKRNPHYDPRKLFEKQMGESVDTIGRTMGEVAKTGQIAKFNAPEFKGAFNDVFGHRFKEPIGKYDPIAKSKIVDSEFYGFIPVPEPTKLNELPKNGQKNEPRTALGMLITYENGAQEVKPITRGGTTEQDDPVLTFTPKELMGQMRPIFVAREIAKSPEMYKRHIQSLEGALNPEAKLREQKVIESNISGLINQKQKAEKEIIKKYEKMMSDSNGMPLSLQQENALQEKMQEEIKALRASYNLKLNNTVKSYGGKLSGTAYGYLLDTEDQNKADETPPPSNEADETPPPSNEAKGNAENSVDSLFNSIIESSSSTAPQSSPSSQPKTLSDIPQSALNM